MKNKIELRNKIKLIRKTFDINAKSTIITENIRHTSIYKNAQNIMLFYPTKYEINLLKLLNDEKNFYFPKVYGEDLLVCPNCGEFKKSVFNINEPCSSPVNPAILDLIIVPALAVDKENYRLGYGGGYYDKFLAKYPDITTITPIFKEFILDELPKNKFDIKIDYICSD